MDIRPQSIPVLYRDADPGVNDLGSEGTKWVNRISNEEFTLTDVTAGVATWKSITSTASSLPTDYKDFNKVASVTNPAASDARMWVDTNGIAHLQDENGEEILMASADVKDGIAGAVGVVDNVQTGMLNLILEANPFRNNILGRDGDVENGVGGGSVSVDSYIPTTGEKFLIVVNLIANNITSGNWYRIYGAGSKIATNNSGAITSASPLGRYYDITTADNIGSGTLTRAVGSLVGSVDCQHMAFSLTNLGTLSTNQALAVNSLATLYSWTLASTVDNTTAWSAIATWLGTESERNEFWTLVIDKHVSGYDPVEVSEVVNRGGNLAYLPPTLINTTTIGNADASSISDGFIIDITVSTSLTLISKLSILPDTEYALRATMETVIDNGGSQFLLISGTDDNSSYTTVGYVNLDLGGTQERTFTTPTKKYNYYYITFNNTSGGNGNKFKITNIQLNQGSTANTYSTPLNSPLIVGSRSVNQLSNGNGEKGAYGWSDVTYTSPDLIVTASATPATKDFTAKVDGIHTFAVKNKTVNTVSVQGTLNGTTSSTVQGDAANPWSVASVVLVAGTTYTFTVTASANLTKIQNMIIEGEYTQAEIDGLGYIIPDPIVLHNSGDDTDNKSDSMEQIGDVINVIHNVETVAGYNVGDPEIDPTELITLVNDTDFSGGTIGNWIVLSDTGNGTLAYDGVNPSAEKVAKITVGSTTGTYTAGKLPSTAVTAYTPNRAVKVSAMVYLPTGHNFTSVEMMKNGLSDWSELSATDGDITIVDSWQLISKTFIVGSDIVGDIAVRGFSVTVGDVMYFDDISFVNMNIWQSTAPTVEDITPFCNGSLNQPADNGQNHIITHGGIVKSVHREGIGGIVDNLSSEIQGKANKTDLNPDYECGVILPAMIATNVEIFYFTDFSAVNSKFPEYMDNATKKVENLNGESVTATVYNNVLVIEATGAVADNAELDFVIGSAEEKVTVDRSA